MHLCELILLQAHIHIGSEKVNGSVAQSSDEWGFDVLLLHLQHIMCSAASWSAWMMLHIYCTLNQFDTHMRLTLCVSHSYRSPIAVWALNSTLNGAWQPVSISKLSTTWSFNPYLGNVTALLAAGDAYFNVHTTQVSSHKATTHTTPQM